ncbi:MAG: SDR family NAD(P)-dependent oxidoreductase [Proteobacteria bacterium]|nr:SDR family NAD(P)-dependent oxidoreductase [Pseudomonadota bacterium]
MATRLDGRRAVVTGGAQGFGHAIVKRLREEGAEVCIWDHDADLTKQVVADFGGGVRGVQVDVTDTESIAAAVAESTAGGGRIDILVNNAGIAGPSAKVWEYPVDEWRQVIEIDLNGVFYCCRAVVPVMLQTGYGRIVNIASIAGKEGNPNAAPYSAAKAGVIGLTKSLGKELADTDILVNCVTPAAAKTRIFDQISQAQVDYMLSKIPKARFVAVSELAAMVAWLSSDECSFSTGAVFDISGGRATY